MRKTTLLHLLLITFIGFIISSCHKDEGFEPKVEIEDGSIMKVNVNPTDLGDRMVYSWEPIETTDVSNSPMLSQYFAKGSKAKKDSYYWELLAEMPVLEHNGHKLSATQIEISDDYAYVSYNAQGSAHVGAIEIIDLSNELQPTVVSYATFDDIDINSVTIDKIASKQQMTIWLGGSRNKDGAVVIELKAVNGVIQGESKIVSLAKVFEEGISASANSICKVKKYLYITTGKTKGGIIKLDIDDLSYVKHVSFSSAKYVLSNNDNQNAGNKVIVLSTGNNAKLRVFDLDLSDNPSTYDLGVIKHNVTNNDYTYSGKNTMSINNNKKLVYIAMGDRGAITINHSTGEQVYTSQANMLSIGNTNAITLGKDFVYLANGADGLAIALTPDSNNPEITPIFTWDMQMKPASANYVIYEKDFIFLAKGQGGVKILRKLAYGDHPGISAADNNGVPTNLEDDQPVCSTLLPAIYSSILPNGVNAYTAHPEYFNNTIKNVELTKDAEILLTFIDEGAGYKNSLGYYYYNKDNPPASVEDLINKQIIFHNVSKQGSGGGLVKGNTMKLLGSFDENTVIGFFLIANGWNSSKKAVTDGYHTVYSNPEFNKSNNIQTVTFYDQTCGTVVISFEDLILNKGDNDFNDAIFQISSIPADAINVSTYHQITP